jgi:exodeoxyribonuclease-3
MKIATYNVNGIGARLPLLLEWLHETKPDVACLQELKAPDASFPQEALKKAGYGAVWLGQKSWNGVAILAKGTTPQLIHRGLPGEPDPSQSRYIEANVFGLLIGCLYLPNGNPAPGPKFEHKLSWLQVFEKYAASLLKQKIPAVLAGDYKGSPHETDFIAR